jgi:guanine nucleotide-binding protein G(i) subunit alpha
MFVVSIASYNQMLLEDNTVNRLSDAMGLFEEICSNELLRNTCLLLFMNKFDLFTEKIQKFPLNERFEDFKCPGKLDI